MLIGEIGVIFVGHASPFARTVAASLDYRSQSAKVCRQREFPSSALQGVIIVQRMAGPRDVAVRQPAVAGVFYPSDPRQCHLAAERLFTEARRANERAGQVPGKWIGGIVPHAGWICSGAIAAQTLDVLSALDDVNVVVVFGAVHSSLDLAAAALDSHQQWVVPGGCSEVQQALSRRLAERPEIFVVDDRFHEHEHAVEVELPLICAKWPNAALLPLEVPLIAEAAEVGQRTAGQIESLGLRAIYLASSDLTHYGPAYHFAPVGVGAAGLAWAKENDLRLLERVQQMEVETIGREVAEHQNACGGGAIVAMLAACREAGAASARLLAHASSFETLAGVAPQRPDNAVGYASVVVG
jgi:MEMO1 family protein